MTHEESVIADWLMERGYTLPQVVRALVALTLLEPAEPITREEMTYVSTTSLVAARDLMVIAIKDGYWRGTPPAPRPAHGPTDGGGTAEAGGE